MNPWEVLGIPQTYDEGEVRRAYARMLKIRRPEDDMQAFQALRTAYDQVLAMCRFLRNRPEELVFGDEWEDAQEPPDGNEPLPAPVRPPEDAQPHLTISGFLAAFRTLADDFAAYPDSVRWLALLDRADGFDFWEHRQLGRALADILPGYACLPSFVWVKLEEAFHWEQERGLLDGLFSDVELNKLKSLGNVARLLCSEEILPFQGGPEYLGALGEVYASPERIKNHDIQSRLNGLTLSVAGDAPPAALRLHLSLLYSMGDWQALRHADRFYAGRYTDTFTSLLCGAARRHLGDFSGALIAYEDILRRNPDQVDALRWSGLCMERLGDASAALIRYRDVLERSPGDVYARCAIRRLTNTDTGKRSFWRDWYYKIEGMFFQSLRIIFILFMIAMGVIGFFVLFLSPFVSGGV